MLLDKGLLESGQFVPQVSKGSLLKVLRETTEILQGQAALRKITIEFKPSCAEMELEFD